MTNKRAVTGRHNYKRTPYTILLGNILYLRGNQWFLGKQSKNKQKTNSGRRKVYKTY